MFNPLALTGALFAATLVELIISLIIHVRSSSEEMNKSGCAIIFGFLVWLCLVSVIFDVAWFTYKFLTRGV